MDELVNIPALLLFSDGGTQFQGLSVFMVCTLIASRKDLGKSGSIFSRSCQEMKSLADSIQAEELSRKTSRVKATVTVP